MRSFHPRDPRPDTVSCPRFRRQATLKVDLSIPTRNRNRNRNPTNRRFDRENSELDQALLAIVERLESITD